MFLGSRTIWAGTGKTDEDTGGNGNLSWGITETAKMNTANKHFKMSGLLALQCATHCL